MDYDNAQTKPEQAPQSDFAQQTPNPYTMKWGLKLMVQCMFMLSLPYMIVQMAPILADPIRRNLPEKPEKHLREQWRNPDDVITVLLILGDEVVGRALAQLSGSWFTPVAFSFGWVGYAVTAVVTAVGDDKLMPQSDCSCMVINGKTGFVRHNTSWIIGRIVRDFDSWKDAAVADKVHEIIEKKFNWDKEHAKPGAVITKSSQAGLCVSIYEAEESKKGHPGFDRAFQISCFVICFQFAVALAPLTVFGDWSVFLITLIGTLLAILTGMLPQWRKEKWACRDKTKKNVTLTRGNGSQHAFVVLGTKKGLDLEDLASGQANVDESACRFTRWSAVFLALGWITLLITAAGVKQNTWFLLTIGGVGIIQNVYLAGCRRTPEAFGVPLKFVEVIGAVKVMDALYAVEEQYHHIGASMVDTFFPEKLRPNELARWEEFAVEAKRKDREAEEREEAAEAAPTAAAAAVAAVEVDPSVETAQS